MLKMLVTALCSLALTAGAAFAWSTPQLVEVEGYTSPMTEPAISADGKTLFWQNGVQPPQAADVHYAEWKGNRWVYKGAVEGANLPNVLDGTPAITSDGIFSFISSRVFPPTQWVGDYKEGVVSNVVQMPVQIEAPYYVLDGEFPGDDTNTAVFTIRHVDNPAAMDIVIGELVNGKYWLSSDVLWRVNTADREYAPEMDEPQTTLFFTRHTNGQSQIFYTTRWSKNSYFRQPQRISSIPDTWMVEAPTLGPNGELYFHRGMPNGERRLYVIHPN